MKRTTETITFSLPPTMAAQVRAVMRAEGPHHERSGA